jgi:hypothetical protein
MENRSVSSFVHVPCSMLLTLSLLLVIFHINVTITMRELLRYIVAAFIVILQFTEYIIMTHLLGHTILLTGKCLITMQHYSKIGK